MNLFFTLFLLLSNIARADRYIGDDASGTLTFDMSASLHDIKSQATSYTSELIIGEQVTGKLVVQALGLKTGIGVRDKRMYNFCLSSDQYPTIEFTVRGATGDLAGLSSGQGSGSVNLHGQLKVRSTTRDVQIPVKYTWADGTLQLKGAKQIKWTDYSVPDPSIVISKLAPEIHLSFNMKLVKSF